MTFPPYTRPMSRRRILHLTTPGEVGGLESVVHGLALGHRARGHDVHVAAVLAPGQSADAFLEPLERCGVRVDVLTFGHRAYLREREAIRQLVRRVRPDVVHTHGYRSDLLHTGAARGTSARIVSTVHGSSRMGGLSHAYEWLQLRMLRRHDAVIAVSRALVPILLTAGVPGDRVHMIPNALVPGHGRRLARAAARQALGLPADGFAIGWIGRLIQAKAADVFVRALARCGDHPWSAAVVGDGPERQTIASLVHELGIADRVRMPGVIPSAQQLLSAFDLFVLSSRTEGTPMVLLEAVAARVPVVATAVGGVPDVVSDTGALLVPTEDPGALAAAIRSVQEDPDAAAKRVDIAARRAAHEFGPEQWLDAHERVYFGPQAASLVRPAREVRRRPQPVPHW